MTLAGHTLLAAPAGADATATRPALPIAAGLTRSPEEAERQARGESTIVREEVNLDDLGLEVGAALAEGGDGE